MANYEEALKDCIIRNLKELEEHDNAYKFSGYAYMLKTINRCSYATVDDLVKIVSRDTDLTQKVLKEVLNLNYEEIVNYPHPKGWWLQVSTKHQSLLF